MEQGSGGNAGSMTALAVDDLLPLGERWRRQLGQRAAELGRDIMTRRVRRAFFTTRAFSCRSAIALRQCARFLEKRVEDSRSRWVGGLAGGQVGGTGWRILGRGGGLGDFWRDTHRGGAGGDGGKGGRWGGSDFGPMSCCGARFSRSFYFLSRVRGAWQERRSGRNGRPNYPTITATEFWATDGWPRLSCYRGALGFVFLNLQREWTNDDPRGHRCRSTVRKR
jgi:hypothetical protein